MISNNMFVKIVIFLMLIFAPGCGSSGDDSGITYDLEADGLIKRQFNQKARIHYIYVWNTRPER
jgi:hypothetical protein